MDDTLNTVNLQIRISRYEHESLVKLKERIGAKSLQVMVRNVLRDAIEGRGGYPYPAHRAEHEEFEQILQDTDLSNIARQQLRLWAELLAAKKSKSKQTKAG